MAFFHRRTNLSSFTKDFPGEDQLNHNIGNFSQVLLRQDRPERMEYAKLMADIQEKWLVSAAPSM